MRDAYHNEETNKRCDYAEYPYWQPYFGEVIGTYVENFDGSITSWFST